MMQHQVAMLGTGLIGDFYTMSLHAQRSRDRVRIVYSRSEERGSAFRERWDIAESTTDLQTAIEHPEGWCLRYRRGGKALFTLIPCEAGFTALVVVGPHAWPDVATLGLSASTRAAWDAARPYPDGRWLWLDVVDDRVVTDIERLVALKSPPPKRRRVACPV